MVNPFEASSSPTHGRAEDAQRHAPAESLSLRVVDEITHMIYSGELKPGERLNEVALAGKMGVSRGPVREAIRILTGFGLVTPVLNHGAYVRELSVGEMVEISELRAVVFGFLAGSAAEQRSAADVEQLAALVEHMDQAVTDDDSDAYYRLNLEFHNVIAHLGRNQRGARVYSDFVKELHLFRRQNFDNPGNMRKSVDEHRRIYEAIVARDRQAAAHEAEQHILAGCQRMLRDHR